MSRRRKKKNNTINHIIIVLIITLISSVFIKDYPNESYSNKNNVSTNLQIYFLDVGQADSILITNNGHNMLIDAGNNEDGPKLVKYLKNSLGIENFEYVVGTHPHEDHVGGLDDMINNFNIEKVLLPEATTTTKTYEDVLDAIDNKNLSITVPEIGSTFKLGEADFEVIYTGTDEKDLNNSSIVLKMIFGEFSYLFTGDATDKVEELILNKNIDIDVLKVGHHGSAYSTTKEFLSKVTPDYAIISVAKENSYGHPSSDTIDRIKKYTDKIYMTSESGTILLESDGQNINFTTFKTNTNG